jgi:Bacterial Ig domain
MQTLGARGLSTFALCLALAVAGCAKKQAAATTGGAHVALTAAALSPAVAEVIVTVKPGDGPAFTPFSANLTKNADGWSAFITSIPAGPQRLFEVVANDASHVLLHSGSAKADVVAGQAALVVVTLSSSSPSDGFTNQAPVVEYVSASQSTVVPGGVVSLGISAHDPDPGDLVSYEWSATCGTFDSTTSTRPSWTAPAQEGRCQITAKVSDNRGASVSAFLAIDVAATGTGDVLVSVSGFNSSPVITAMSAAVRYEDPIAGELSVTATDPDGDPLGYAWASNCGQLQFASGTAASTQFTIGTGTTSCVVTVRVTDGKGGLVIGSVTIPTAAPPLNLAPVITHTVQPNVDLSNPTNAEPVSAGDSITLVAEAFDPEGAQLTFEWTATSGTLDGATAQTASPGTSTAVLHVPSPVPTSFSVTVKVSDPLNEFSTHDFWFKPVDPCAGQPDGTACDDGNPCTQTDTCQAGICQGSNPVVCAAPPACKLAGVCQATGANAGTCTYADAPTGAACDDGKSCTTDACAAGVCVGTQSCPAGQACDANGQCAGVACDPVANCQGRVCGSDGCGGNCSPGCTGTDTCNAAGQCVSACDPVANCQGKVCGSDGCGGNCSPGCTGTDTCNAAGQCIPAVTVTNVVPTRANDVRIIAPGAVDLDASANTYLSGYFGSIIGVDFQTRAGGPAINLTSQGGLDAFLAKYDATGEIVNAILIGDNNPNNPTDQSFTRVAVALGGRVATIGKFAGSVTMGSSTVSAANPAPVVAGFTSDLAKSWVNLYDMGSNGLFQSITANKVAIPGGANDRIAACGYADAASTSLDDKAVYGGSQDATIGAWDAVTGAKLWGRQIGTTALNENCAAVAIDANGDVVAVGQFDGASIDFGDGFVLTGPNSTAQKFLWIAKFNGATGQTLAAAKFNGTAGSAIPRAIAIAPNANIAVAGSFTGNLVIGAQIVGAGSEDGFIALLDPAFAPVWNAVRIGGTAADLVRTVAFTSLGDIVAMGQFGASSASFRTTNGGDTTGLATLTSLGGIDAMVLKLNGATGATEGAKSYGNSGTQSGDVVAVNRFGGDEISFTITSFGSVDFGGGVTYTSGAAADVALVLAKLQ